MAKANLKDKITFAKHGIEFVQHTGYIGNHCIRHFRCPFCYE